MDSDKEDAAIEAAVGIILVLTANKVDIGEEGISWRKKMFPSDVGIENDSVSVKPSIICQKINILTRVQVEM